MFKRYSKQSSFKKIIGILAVLALLASVVQVFGMTRVTQIPRRIRTTGIGRVKVPKTPAVPTYRMPNNAPSTATINQRVQPAARPVNNPVIDEDSDESVNHPSHKPEAPTPAPVDPNFALAMNDPAEFFSSAFANATAGQAAEVPAQAEAPSVARAEPELKASRAEVAVEEVAQETENVETPTIGQPDPMDTIRRQLGVDQPLQAADENPAVQNLPEVDDLPALEDEAEAEREAEQESTQEPIVIEEAQPQESSFADATAGQDAQEVVVENAPAEVVTPSEEIQENEVVPVEEEPLIEQPIEQVQNKSEPVVIDVPFQVTDIESAQESAAQEVEQIEVSPAEQNAAEEIPAQSVEPVIVDVPFEVIEKVQEPVVFADDQAAMGQAGQPAVESAQEIQPQESTDSEVDQPIVEEVPVIGNEPTEVVTSSEEIQENEDEAAPKPAVEQPAQQQDFNDMEWHRNQEIFEQEAAEREREAQPRVSLPEMPEISPSEPIIESEFAEVDQSSQPPNFDVEESIVEEAPSYNAEELASSFAGATAGQAGETYEQRRDQRIKSKKQQDQELEQEQKEARSEEEKKRKLEQDEREQVCRDAKIRRTSGDPIKPEDPIKNDTESVEANQQEEVDEADEISENNNRKKNEPKSEENSEDEGRRRGPIRNIENPPQQPEPINVEPTVPADPQAPSVPADGTPRASRSTIPTSPEPDVVIPERSVEVTRPTNPTPVKPQRIPENRMPERVIDPNRPERRHTIVDVDPRADRRIPRPTVRLPQGNGDVRPPHDRPRPFRFIRRLPTALTPVLLDTDDEIPEPKKLKPDHTNDPEPITWHGPDVTRTPIIDPTPTPPPPYEEPEPVVPTTPDMRVPVITPTAPIVQPAVVAPAKNYGDLRKWIIKDADTAYRTRFDKQPVEQSYVALHSANMTLPDELARLRDEFVEKRDGNMNSEKDYRAFLDVYYRIIRNV